MEKGNISVMDKNTLYLKHEDKIANAIRAIHERHFFAQYPEAPSKRIYGEEANANGLAAFKNQLGKAFNGLQQSYDSVLQAKESSPYTLDALNISYSAASDSKEYLNKAQEASLSWKKADVYTRAGLLVESLERLKQDFFEMAFATMHTTGQSYMMSFQASGPHANDRALEAIALGVFEQTRFPDVTDWEKPMGKFDIKLKKYYKSVPLGISLAIGCSTFPVWNTAPGVFASLVTGNPVIVKPHPKAIYPLAIMVRALQQTFKENGFDPYIVQLATDLPDAPITKELAEAKEVKLIDYTGGNNFGDYIESLPGKRTFTEKAGINSIVLHSARELKPMMQNIAFSLSLYSGQMCTCPQNIFIPKSGIEVGGERLSYAEVVDALASAVKGLVTHEKMGAGTLGAIQNEATCTRVEEALQANHKVLLDSQKVINPDFPKARIQTPVLLEVDGKESNVYSEEVFGPVAFVIPVDDAQEGVALAKKLASEKGAITFAAYCTDADLQTYMIDEMSDAYTSIAFNFVGPVWVNQSAGFSDFHVTGGNPAGNASLTDPEFVLKRFEIVGIRIHE